MRSFLWYQFPLVLACTAIFVVSSIPSVPGIPLLQDKIPHAIVFGVLGILAYRAFRYQDRLRPLRAWPAISAIVFAICYGVTDEVHQLFVPGRHADVWDVVADAVGALIFVTIAARLTRPDVSDVV